MPDPWADLARIRPITVERYKLIGRASGSPQRHDWHELIYVLQGRHRVQTAGRRLIADADHWLHHPAGSRHAASSDTGSHYAALLLLWSGPALPCASGPHRDQGGRLRLLLESAARIWNRRPVSHLRRRALVTAALCEAMEIAGGTSEDDDPLDRARRFAEDQFALATLTVTDLAQLSGFSRAHFSRRFAARYGESPARYLRLRRLEAARALLASSARSVDAIARQVGLRDGTELARLLRRYEQRTPSSLRRPG